MYFCVSGPVASQKNMLSSDYTELEQLLNTKAAAERGEVQGCSDEGRIALVEQLDEAIERAKWKALGIPKGTLCHVFGLENRKDLNYRMATAMGECDDVTDRERVKMCVGGECTKVRRRNLLVLHNETLLKEVMALRDLEEQEVAAARQVLRIDVPQRNRPRFTRKEAEEKSLRRMRKEGHHVERVDDLDKGEYFRFSQLMKALDHDTDLKLEGGWTNTLPPGAKDVPIAKVPV